MLDFSTLGPIACKKLHVIPLKICEVLLKLRRSAIVSRLGSYKLVPLYPRFLKLGIQFHDSDIFVRVRNTYFFDVVILLTDQLYKSGVVLIEFRIFKPPLRVLVLEFFESLGHAREISRL